ncbi:MAG: ABC transporter permease [Acidobacteriia bacterium]|nr:ABC transporter permease [Terriglobia bacterium]
MRRILAQARKELVQILRDRRALGLALIFPLVQLVLMGAGISLDVDELPVVVQDFDNSPASQKFVDKFRASISFHVVSWPVQKQPEQAFTSHTARATLIIPEHFGRDIARGTTSPVQLLVDASDSNTARLLAGYARQITTAFNQDNGEAAHPEPVRADIRLWYNPERSSKKFYGPGIFVLVLTIFPSLLASLAMSKEGEQKTILQVFVSSISAHEFLLGKILAFAAISLSEALLCLILLFTYFGTSFAGDPTPFVVATLLYAFCVPAFGTLLGAAIPDQAAAVQAVGVFSYLLVFLLGGLIFPIENIPAVLRWISNLVWGRYYIEVVRDAFLQGGGWSAAWFKVLAIALFGMIFYLVAWRKMRRMQLEA